MARQERPLDPADGPLQSFAYDLRKVRLEAGNPTYRVLAKSAGYSATTLSEAASGLRKPSLDVVLAYVGACHGDVDEWRRRWYDLDRSLRPQAAAEPQAPVTAEAEQPGPPETSELPESPAQRPRWRRPGTVAAAAVVVATASGLGVLLWLHDPQPASAQGCPKAVSRPAFTGMTYGGGAHARTGATRDDPVVYTIPGNCTVGFTGYCIGQKVHDSTGQTPDVRWFKLGDGTVISSAIIHGNPPAALKPTGCTHDRPAPQAVAFTIDTSTPGSLTMRATGVDVDIVGFAVSRPGDPHRWHQIGFTDTLSATWRIDQNLPAGEATVVAAACFGGDGATGAVAAKTLRAQPLTVLATQPVLAPQQLTEAARAACQYPSPG